MFTAYGELLLAGQQNTEYVVTPLLLLAESGLNGTGLLLSGDVVYPTRYRNFLLLRT